MAREDSSPLAILARVLMVVTVAAICLASLAPSQLIPRFLYSYHLEHFAAFYLVALSMAAARYRLSVPRVLLDVALLATVLEGARLFTPSRQLYVAEDWVADLGGAMAALSPVLIGDFRRSFTRPPAERFAPDATPGEPSA
jgi:hypothetical protein